jgi:hypothetical protein
VSVGTPGPGLGAIMVHRCPIAPPAVRRSIRLHLRPEPSLPNIEVVRKILALTGRPEDLIQHVTDRPGMTADMPSRAKS